MSNEELNKLIDRYFNAETSVEEERLLRKILLSCVHLSSRQQEVLAVMGYCAAVPKKKRNPFRLSLKYAAVAGATIVLIASFGILLGNRAATDPTCIAYVEGVEINDKTEVMQLVAGQLAEMSSMSQEMTREMTNNMNELRNALNLE